MPFWRGSYHLFQCVDRLHLEFIQFETGRVSLLKSLMQRSSQSCKVGVEPAVKGSEIQKKTKIGTGMLHATFFESRLPSLTPYAACLRISDDPDSGRYWRSKSPFQLKRLCCLYRKCQYLLHLKYVLIGVFEILMPSWYKMAAYHSTDPGVTSIVH